MSQSSSLMGNTASGHFVADSFRDSPQELPAVELHAVAGGIIGFPAPLPKAQTLFGAQFPLGNVITRGGTLNLSWFQRRD